MSKAAMNLQDSFLNQVRRENSEVKILLVNGTVLKGAVKGFDNFTVILNSSNGTQHLIYKHAIAQVVNQRHGGSRHDVELHDDSESAPENAREDSSPGDSAKKTKKGGFNMLDLSSVKLQNKDSGKTPVK